MRDFLEGNGKIGDEGAIKKLKKRKPKIRQKDKVKLDEPSRLQRRSKFLMILLKLEQNLIDAYSEEGWNGQSWDLGLAQRHFHNYVSSYLLLNFCHRREKIRPEKELLRARKQILKCKLGLRDLIRQVDSLSTVGFIEVTVTALDGSVSHEHIFCAKCKSNEISPDNDIVLCDAITDAGNVLLKSEEEWPSDDSEDDNYDPERRDNFMSEAGTDNDASDDISSSTSLGWSSDGEVFSGYRRCAMDSLDFRKNSIHSSLDSDETSDGEIDCGRRRIRTIDYKKLSHAVFGKDAPAHEQASEDEDWGPGKRKRREEESDAVSTVMTLCESKRNCNDETIEGMMKFPPQTRRPISMLPPDAVEKLRQVFVENELPSRTVKENLSKELGLEPGKVGKWFMNSRYLALKSRKVEKVDQLHNSSSNVSAEPTLNVMENKTADLSLDSWAETELCSYESPTKSNEMNAECSDDLSLKKLLKAKPNGLKKKVNPISTAAEYDMERLCRTKAILEKMKQKVVKLQNGKARKSSKTHSLEESVVYIPIAELRGEIDTLCNL
ncbi:hypothetical protein SADUNF_Sadunf06G0056900 [Salix dunnii]|uniref:Homeobox domain-containing protein n=1 Tax=Salix dunnii TaxID=1413687 RepID=A0A835K5P0_9ROSI|nr:hypothetical protein SADUNF_Sadunf06G0056900 [Salix dunnii]